MATTYPAVISTTSLDGTNGFRITGNPGKGYWSSMPFVSVGDVTGDGLGDLVAGYWGGAGFSDDHVIKGYILPSARGGFSATVNIGKLSNFTFTDRRGNYSAFEESVLLSGMDFNGDGFTDIVIGANHLLAGADDTPIELGGPDYWRYENGGAVVLFGTKDGFPFNLDRKDFDGQNGVVISYEKQSYRSVARDVAAPGDTNGDGIDDLLVTTDGGFHLIYGKTDGFGARLFLESMTAKDGTRFFSSQDKRGGWSVAEGGDINGDGNADIIAGTDSGSLVIFGKAGGLGAALDTAKLDGRNGFAIKGANANEKTLVAAAGDLNADGFGDLIVRTWDGSNSSIPATASIVFGKKGGFEANFDVTRFDGTNGFRITSEAGRFINDVAPTSTIGDFNGDGIDDLAFAQHVTVDGYDFGKGRYSEGSFYYDTSLVYSAANVYVIYGKKSGFGPALSTGDLSGDRGFIVTGIDDLYGHNTPIRLTAPGDMNGDGVDDLSIDAQYAGDYVIFGKGDFKGVTRNGTSASEALSGTSKSDVLNGNRGNDSLIGGAGDDRLDGGLGADRMEGGLGNDTYRVDDARDTVIEKAPSSYQRSRDTVITTVDYALVPDQEIEILQADPTSRVGLKLVGNEFRNMLVGAAGNDLLIGADDLPRDHDFGRDTLFGGAGNDTYVVAEFDNVVEAEGQGNDLVLASSDYSLGYAGEVERLQLLKQTGSARFDLSGNQYAQTIIGNNGRNLLDGNGTKDASLGADSLYGKRGGDVYVVHRSDDKVFELVGEGHDTVTTHVSYTLAAGQEIEALQFRNFNGKANLDLTGNEFTNTIYGNAGDNVLDGRLGADVLNGRLGADTFAFSTKLGAGNVDRITDFDARDTIQLSKAIFAGLTPGPLAAGAFKDLGVFGAKLEADDRILYDSRTGALAFDADGSGAEAAVQFATLANRAALTAADFLIV